MLVRFHEGVILEARRVLVLFVAACGAALSSGCATHGADVETVAVQPLSEDRVEIGTSEIRAITLLDGSLLTARTVDRACVLETLSLDGEERLAAVVAMLETCPDRIDVTASGDLLLRTSQGTVWFRHGSFERITTDLPILDAASTADHVMVSEEGLVWDHQGRRALAEGLSSNLTTILDAEDALVTVRSSESGDQVVRIDWPEDGQGMLETVLTDTFEQIASIEFDRDQKELAAAVWRNGSYDILIANAEKQYTNWVPSDPADEETPRWSPVGYKLSYIVRNPSGDILRTVHVPTAAMVAADFPEATVRDYLWLPDGERVLVALSSALVSDHVVEVSYTGSSRRVIVEPELRFDRDVDRIPGTPPGSVLLMPGSLRYGHSRPVVVWPRAKTSRGMEFDPDLVPLLERTDIGIVLVNGSVADLEESFWSSMSEATWIDPNGIWMIGLDESGENLPVEFAGRVNRVATDPDLETATWLVKEIDGRGSDR